MKFIKTLPVLFFLITFFSPFLVDAQISADSDFVISTDYSSGSQDQIYIFCAAQDQNAGTLTAQSSNGSGANFEWLKYNSSTGSFDPYLSDNSGNASSNIQNLDDGGYRVNVTSGGITETYTAWVMNSWYTATAEITESTCEYFQLTASFDEAQLSYYDLATGAPKQIFKDVKAEWTVGGNRVANVLSPQIFNPPTEDTNYTLRVYDRFGCQVEVPVTYQSIVTEASFTFVVNTSVSNGKYEAPAEIAFTSTSKNADQYEWFFFRDRSDLIKEGEGSAVVDSILDTAINQNPVYTYENSGEYMVKLVTTKNGENTACTDTFYMEDYLVVDTSFVSVPNVFTPNGDAVNDEFVVGYWSLKEINIQIFNRWGKKVHSWENNNIQGFGNTVYESVWDGKIGGRYASPGVYYYVVEALGRDDQKRFAHGFVHLFRSK